MLVERLESRQLLSGDPIVLGPQTDMSDQPYVDIEMFDGLTGIGPYGDSGGWFGVSYNHFLLDTGSNSILSAREATQAFLPNTYQTEGTFLEQGVAGYTEFDISAPYKLRFQGTSGPAVDLPQTTDDVRILSSETVELGAELDAGGIAGLVGMPAMVDRVTTFDMSQWRNSSLFDLTPLGVSFSDQLPYTDEPRYSVAVDDRVEFFPQDGLPPDSPPDAPVPSWAPVPFLTAVAESQGNSQSGTFLFDTGAQLSMISTSMAFALGLDANGNGDLVDDSLGTLPIGGVGGEVDVPVMLIDAIRLPTEQGVDLAWRGTDPGELGIEVLVLDIDERIQGVFGADLLTAGLGLDWGTLESTGGAYFDKVHLDFGNLRNGSGKIYFDLYPYRAEILGQLDTLAEGGSSDTYQVVLRSQPTSNVTIYLDDYVDPDTGIVELNAVDGAHPQNPFLVFTPLNWSTPQTVQVTAIDNGIAEGPHSGWITHRAVSADARYAGIRIACVEAHITEGEPASVVGRHVFYNNSAWDGFGPGASPADDDAIAVDKTALLPGQTATSANYTSYDKGINGIMLDVAGLPAGVTLDPATDFSFKVGNNNNPDTWTPAPPPLAIDVRPGDGVDGSARVTIVWDDHQIEKQWLQVTVDATVATNLAQPDVFYFGNAPGESGNQPGNAIVNATDEIMARNFPHGLLNSAAIDDPFDYNRDHRVDGTDQIIARGNQTNPLSMLRLIAAPLEALSTKQAAAAELGGIPGVANATGSSGTRLSLAERVSLHTSDAFDRNATLARLAWMYEFQQVNAPTRSAKTATPAEQAVDRLLASYWL